MPKITLDPSFVKDVQSLNRAADDIAETIKDLDRQLAEAGVGIEMWLDLWQEQSLSDSKRGDGESVPWLEETQIGYGRVGGKYMLAVRAMEGEDLGNDTEYYESHRYALVGASRAIRVEAEAKLPELVEDIQTEVKRQLLARQ